MKLHTLAPMTPERWQQIRLLFDAVVELDPGEQIAVLERDCAGDDDLRAAVLNMLAADRGESACAELAARLAPTVLAALTSATVEGDHIGTMLGPWQLVSELGRGGMGAVYLAVRVDGEYQQQAAIKLIGPSWNGAELAQRLRAERQILASLNHPNIARLLDGGSDAQNRPYLVLEYIDGAAIDVYCDSAALSIEQRLRLFLIVCEAVSHAHQCLVVHRDLKPSNVMVSANGEVKLLDFGIAKLLVANPTDSAIRMFSPEFAAPEQLRGEPPTTSVDVHALGLLLYVLLTGERPFKRTTATPAAYEHAILTAAVERPSEVLKHDPERAAEVARLRGLSAADLLGGLRGDLDAIVLKALRKEPQQRYLSVAELANDVRATLEHRPVQARQGNLRYVFGLLLRRHALAAGLGGLAIVSLIVGAGLALWQARVAKAQRDIAQVSATQSKAALGFMVGLFEQADPAKAGGAIVTAADVLSQGRISILGALAADPRGQVQLLTAMARAHLGLGLHAEAIALVEQASNADADGQSALALALIRADALGRSGDSAQVLIRLEPLLLQHTDAVARAALLRRIARAQRVLGKLDQAQRNIDEAVLLAGAAPFDDEVRRTIAEQLNVWVLRREFKRALPVAEKALLDARAVRPPQPLLVVEAIASLAMVVSWTGPMARAEALRREQLSLVESMYGPEHPITLTTLNDLGSVLYGDNRCEQALPMFQRVVTVRLQSAQPNAALVATSRSNLAKCLLALNRADEAAPLVELALQERLKLYGEANVHTAINLHQMGQVALEQNQPERAQQWFLRAIDSYTLALGADSMTALAAINDLGRASIALGRPDCSIAERAIALTKMTADDAAPEAHYQRGLLAACRLASGDESARPELLRAVAGVRNFKPTDARIRRLDALLARYPKP